MATEYKVRIKYDTSGNVTGPQTSGSSGGSGQGSSAQKEQTTATKKQIPLLGKALISLGIIAAAMKALQSVLEPMIELFSIFFLNLFALVKEQAGKQIEAMNNAWTDINDAISAVFNGDWAGVLENLWSALNNFYKAIFGWNFEDIWNVILAGWDMMKDVGVWIWEQILKPAFMFMADVGMWIWEQILKPAFMFIGDIGKWIWDQIIKPAFNFLSDVGSWIWEELIKPGFNGLLNIGSMIWEHMKSAFLWTVDLGAKLWDWVKSKISGVFGGGSSGTRAFGGVVPKDGMYMLHSGESVSRGYTTGSSSSSNQYSFNINVGAGGEKSERFAREIARQMMDELSKVQRF